MESYFYTIKIRFYIETSLNNCSKFCVLTRVKTDFDDCKSL